MALCFITGNIPTDTITHATYYPSVVTNSNSFTVQMDDTDNGVQSVIQDPSSSTFSTLMTGKSYIKTQYNGANLIVTLMNPPLTPPTSAKISILGQLLDLTLTNNQVVVPIAIHPSVANQRIQATVRVDGFPYSYIDIAGAQGNIPVQMYQDASGNYHCVPQTTVDLSNYWTNKEMNTAWTTADLKTVTDFLVDVVFGLIIPSLNITLTTEQQNGLNDIKTNVLPNLVSTLSNVNPDGVTQNIHYASYNYHQTQAKSAMDNYVSDKTEITKYTTLK